MADAAEILKVLVPVVGALAAVASILMAASAILQNLERARRELAVNLIYNFANQTDWATGRAIGIAKELRHIESRPCRSSRASCSETEVM
jgi:hypothetical protein